MSNYWTDLIDEKKKAKPSPRIIEFDDNENGFIYIDASDWNDADFNDFLERIKKRFKKLNDIP